MNFETPHEREKFIQKHLGIVWYVARRLVLQYQPYMELQEAVGDGMVGLVKAADHYDPAKGSFFPYAEAYIKGEITRRYKQFHSIPLYPAPGQPRGATAVSLLNATRAASTEEESSVFEIPSSSKVADEVIDNETVRLIEQSFDALEMNEFLVIEALYYAEYPLAETAAALEVSVTTINNWHRSALEKLRHRFIELAIVEVDSVHRFTSRFEQLRDDRATILNYIESRGGLIEDPNGNVLKTLSAVTGISFKRARAIIRGLQDGDVVKQLSKIGRSGGMYRLELGVNQHLVESN